MKNLILIVFCLLVSSSSFAKTVIQVEASACYPTNAIEGWSYGQVVGYPPHFPNEWKNHEGHLTIEFNTEDFGDDIGYVSSGDLAEVKGLNWNKDFTKLNYWNEDTFVSTLCATQTEVDDESVVKLIEKNCRLEGRVFPMTADEYKNECANRNNYGGGSKFIGGLVIND